MKWTLISTIVIGLITLSVFQNCAPSHQGNSTDGVTPFDVSKIYPYYDERPDYFNNIQLTKVYEDAGLWKYQFVASAVYVDAPEEDIDVDIRILDQDDKLLCLSTKVRVNSSSNNIMIDNCKSSSKASTVKIQVFLKLALQAAFPTEATSSYIFPL